MIHVILESSINSKPALSYLQALADVRTEGEKTGPTHSEKEHDSCADLHAWIRKTKEDNQVRKERWVVGDVLR